VDPLTTAWLEALERRHLADLTLSEVARALRALSSCYVERRDKLADGGALSSKGKRAAFALFYGPQHLLITREILRALPSATDSIADVIDLGCGTGAAGAAWALAAGSRSIRGFDRHPWAVAEASWTYRQFQLHGRVMQTNIAQPGMLQKRTGAGARRGTAVLAAYAANELAPDGRAVLLTSLLEAHAQGARVLVIEPIARRLTGGLTGGSLPWWRDWQAEVARAGGRADEWRFPADLPPTQRGLARAAGLDPREFTARSLFLSP
jgi:Methyltransferase small domain